MGKHLARVDGKIGDDQAKKYWYVTDHVGSIRAVTDKDGKKVWSADYLAFGKQFGKSAATDFEELHSFTGKEYDPDTGLHYYNARWYDADLGRFISEDPVADPNNPNLYSYGRNNPLRFIDPTGLESLDDTYAAQDAADAENDSYFTSDEISSWGTPGSADNSTGESSSGDQGGTTGGSSTGKQTKQGNKNSDIEIGKTDYKTYRDGSLKSAVVHDQKGNVIYETHFNKDGTIKSQTTNVYGGNTDRTSITYNYTKNGIVVTTKEQDRGLFGLGYITKDSNIKGYNNQEDLRNNNWNFNFNNKGQISIGDNVKVVNGDLLLVGFVTFLEEKSIKYADWLTNYSMKGWDVTNIKDLSKYSYSVNGKLYNANTFGNIEVGYIGEYYGLSGLTKLGSFVVHLDRHGFKHIDDEWRDEEWMDYGAGLFRNDYPDYSKTYKL